LRARVVRAAGSRHANLAMAAVAALDASVFPVPPLALLGTLVLAQPRKAPLYALIAAAFSVVGGLLGYALGHFAGHWVKVTLGVDLDVPVGWLGVEDTLGQLLSSNVGVLALMACVLPTPFKVVAIGSGLLSVNIFSFIAAAILGRGARMAGFCVAVVLARNVAAKRMA
jgi:membrane protein YqaA with SNARE-associated domain